MRPKRQPGQVPSSHPRSRPRTEKKNPTSWEGVSDWYGGIVGDEGSYYHRQVILPKLIPMLELKNNPGTALLDLACGEGILGRSIPKSIAYTGVDIAPSLIQRAKQLDPQKNHRYLVGDVTKPLAVGPCTFSHAAIVLALQNLATPETFFSNLANVLQPQAILCIVLNHPCFRIPRQTSWGVDQEHKIQYRRVDRYLSSMDIPIQMHPGQGSHSKQTLSFHRPLSAYTKWLYAHGFVVEWIDEWCSDKLSEGGAAKMENRARAEIPLFLALRARRRA